MHKVIFLFLMVAVSASLYAEDVCKPYPNPRKIGEGFSNDIWLISTNAGEALLRRRKEKEDPERFVQIVEISKKAFEYGIGPKVIDVDYHAQEMVLEWISNTPWLAYEDNPGPYHKAMSSLKLFHMVMREGITSPQLEYEPFKTIFNNDPRLFPAQFSDAINTTHQILERLRPWLEKHATLCHGDFTKNNVLVSQEGKTFLIDFDSSLWGDPFFDVAKFSIALSKAQRQELLQSYLGHVATPQELAHFELIDMALLMLIAKFRFESVEKYDRNKLSKETLEQLLHDGAVLPTFLDTTLLKNAPEPWQLSALAALKEFLRRRELPEFTEWIQAIEE